MPSLYRPMREARQRKTRRLRFKSPPSSEESLPTFTIMLRDGNDRMSPWSTFSPTTYFIYD
jgi:hypothetical protein